MCNENISAYTDYKNESRNILHKQNSSTQVAEVIKSTSHRISPYENSLRRQTTVLQHNESPQLVRPGTTINETIAEFPPYLPQRCREINCSLSNHRGISAISPQDGLREFTTSTTPAMSTLALLARQLQASDAAKEQFTDFIAPQQNTSSTHTSLLLLSPPYSFPAVGKPELFQQPADKNGLSTPYVNNTDTRPSNLTSPIPSPSLNAANAFLTQSTTAQSTEPLLNTHSTITSGTTAQSPYSPTIISIKTLFKNPPSNAVLVPEFTLERKQKLLNLLREKEAEVLALRKQLLETIDDDGNNLYKQPTQMDANIMTKVLLDILLKNNNNPLTDYES